MTCDTESSPAIVSLGDLGDEELQGRIQRLKVEFASRFQENTPHFYVRAPGR